MGTRFTLYGAEIATAAVLILAGILVGREAYALGAGWGDTGPHAGFFPFTLACVMIAGALGSLVQAILNPVRLPFFEVSEEYIELIKVGVPAVVYIALVPWLGLYIDTLVYVAAFGWWYGRMPWHRSLLVAVVLTVVLYFVLARMFNLLLPVSVFYSQSFPL